MANEELYIGSHVSMSGPDYYVGSVKEALSYGANTFMFYTGAPQNTFRLPLERLKIEEGRALLKENGIDSIESFLEAYDSNAISIEGVSKEALDTVNDLINENVEIVEECGKSRRCDCPLWRRQSSFVRNVHGSARCSETMG